MLLSTLNTRSHQNNKIHQNEISLKDMYTQWQWSNLLNFICVGWVYSMSFVLVCWQNPKHKSVELVAKVRLCRACDQMPKHVCSKNKVWDSFVPKRSQKIKNTMTHSMSGFKSRIPWDNGGKSWAVCVWCVARVVWRRGRNYDKEGLDQWSWSWVDG